MLNIYILRHEIVRSVSKFSSSNCRTRYYFVAQPIHKKPLWLPHNTPPQTTHLYHFPLLLRPWSQLDLASGMRSGGVCLWCGAQYLVEGCSLSHLGWHQTLRSNSILEIQFSIQSKTFKRIALCLSSLKRDVRIALFLSSLKRDVRIALCLSSLKRDVRIALSSLISESCRASKGLKEHSSCNDFQNNQIVCLIFWHFEGYLRAPKRWTGWEWWTGRILPVV